jgi:hypothetical protein
MLVSKTFCSAGSLMYLVPTGLLVTLHYDARGNLTKIYQGFEDKIDLGEDFMKSVSKMGLVPRTIRITGGITDIWGVFYSNKITSNDGILPECEYEDIIADIMSGSSDYPFYAGAITSGAVMIPNASSAQSLMKSAMFDLLPAWLVPSDATEQTLYNYIATSKVYQFEFPLLSGYIIYEGTNAPYYHALELNTIKVNSAERSLDNDGFIKYNINGGVDRDLLVLNYPDAVSFNIQAGSQLVLDGNTVIWSSTKSSKFTKRLPNRITCEHCGKILDVPASGMMTCTDKFCTSLLYPRIAKFCRVLDIELLPVDHIKQCIADKQLQILPDLLLLPEYSDITIEQPLWKIIYATVPADVGLNTDWLIRLCNKCNNQYKTVKYYLDGPRRIRTELDMELPIRFMHWLEIPKNLLELDTIFRSAQIKVQNEGHLVKFDGPAFLRNKTIYITGRFKHGDTADITAILHSYGAVVVTEFDEFIQCVLVGDIKENVNGDSINGARALKIPVIDECDFFAHYNIDEDIQKYLM